MRKRYIFSSKFITYSTCIIHIPFKTSNPSFYHTFYQNINKRVNLYNNLTSSIQCRFRVYSKLKK